MGSFAIAAADADLCTAPPSRSLDRLAVSKGHVWVVRDDILEGGTKQRAAVPFLRELIAGGARELAYASPFCGFAQVALAAACRELGLRATIVAERDPEQAG